MQRQGKKRFAPLFFSPLPLSPTCLSTDKTQARHLPPDEKKQRAQPLQAAAQWPPDHSLPLCHDWTGVVDLSPHFFPIKTNRKRGTGRLRERKKDQKWRKSVRGKKRNRNRAEAKTRKNRKTKEQEAEEERPLHRSSCHRSSPRTTVVLPLHRHRQRT
jgi:hypothetical protein